MYTVLAAAKMPESFNDDYYIAIVTILPILMLAIEVLTNFDESIPNKVAITEWPRPFFWLVSFYYTFSPIIAAIVVVMGILALILKDTSALYQWITFALFVTVLAFLAIVSSVYLRAFDAANAKRENEAAEAERENDAAKVKRGKRKARRKAHRIKAGAAHVKEAHGSALVLEWKLNKTPDPEWMQFLVHSGASESWSLIFAAHDLKLVRNKLSVVVKDRDVEAAARYIKQSIPLANQEFESQVLAKRRREAEQTAARMEQVRGRLRKLNSSDEG